LKQYKKKRCAPSHLATAPRKGQRAVVINSSAAFILFILLPIQIYRENLSPAQKEPASRVVDGAYLFRN